jgi:hypothetical protein
VSDRLEVRLDPERRRRLDVILAARQAPLSTVVRELIDQAYEAVCQERRGRAVEEMARLEIEDLPDPDELNRQLDAMYDWPAASGPAASCGRPGPGRHPPRSARRSIFASVVRGSAATNSTRAGAL